MFAACTLKYSLSRIRGNPFARRFTNIHRLASVQSITHFSYPLTKNVIITPPSMRSTEGRKPLKMRGNIPFPINSLLPFEVEDSLHGISKNLTRQNIGNSHHDPVLINATILILIHVHIRVGISENSTKDTMSGERNGIPIDLIPFLVHGRDILDTRQRRERLGTPERKTGDGFDPILMPGNAIPTHTIPQGIHAGMRMSEDEAPTFSQVNGTGNQFSLPASCRSDHEGAIRQRKHFGISLRRQVFAAF